VSAATTTEERNKTAVRRLLEEGFNGRRLDLVDEVATSDLQVHTHVRPGPEGLTPGREGLREMIRWIVHGWPKSRATIDELVAEGDLVAARFTFSGTHEGWLHGNPPTGRDAAWKEMVFARMRDGKIAELWHELNVLGTLNQIGVLPPLWEMGRIPPPLLRVMIIRKRIKRRFQHGEHGINAWRTATIRPPAVD
jgi:predicted ester cyclase